MHVTNAAFVDKLCERLAVEEGGIKIYEAAIAKFSDETLKAKLEQFKREEAKHRDLIATYLDRLNVTDRMTASARLAEHEGQAFLTLIQEASTAGQLLNILLTVELMDECGWELLINLGRDASDDEMVDHFKQAVKEEKEHLRLVRGFVSALARQEIVIAEQPA